MNEQTDLFGGLKLPNSDKSEVLMALIQNGVASIEDFGWMAGFRTRCGELRNDHGAPISYDVIKSKNRRGNLKIYHKDYLKPENREKAIEVYKRIRG